MSTQELTETDRFVRNLENDADFRTHTEWYDGSICLRNGDDVLWLKVYRGRIVEALDHEPPFGSVVTIAASGEVWRRVSAGELIFTDAIAAGSRHLVSYEDANAEGGGYRTPEVVISGNQFEAGRIHIALRALYNVYARSFA
ncbi:hypothetical protein [Gordonia sp. NPDC127522]|uniref:hypothetical protein n=1 Tax=Gordonia sp. NPDC127522 TaxID=3345390 RepID=UPI00363404BB